MKKRTVLRRLVPVAVACAGAAAIIATAATSHAAVTPIDTTINGVSIKGYLGLTTLNDYGSSLPDYSVRWGSAWEDCKISLGDDAGQLRSVKEYKIKDWGTEWESEFACSASTAP